MPYQALLPNAFRGVLLIWSLVASQASMSATIVYEFSGFINMAPSDMTSISVGDQWSARFLMESNAAAAVTVLPDSDFPNALSGEQSVYQSLSGTLSIGDAFYFSYSGDKGLSVQNDLEINPLIGLYDAVNFFSFPGEGLTVDQYEFDQVSLGFNNLIPLQPVAGPNVVNDTGLPTQALLEAFPSKRLTLSYLLDEPVNGSNFYLVEITGSVSSITVSEVPIPAAVWLFCSALAGLAGVEIRRSHLINGA